MNVILEKSIRDFIREIEITLKIVAQKQVPAELELFKQWLSSFYSDTKNSLIQLQYYVSLNDPDIHQDIFNEFSSLQKNFRLVNTRFLPGLYRNNENDNLSLKVLNWLHAQHKQTQGKAFLILDGDFAILPAVQLPVSYYLPIASQQSLLYLPLFFHELGHYVYQYHRAEMDDLVGDFQKKLESHLTIPIKQNDDKSKEAAEKNKKIIETWYEWCQELFCDAMGLEIGGLTYLKAFSYYLRMQGRSAFYRPEKELFNSSHPVTWLRIKFLVERANKLGLKKEAKELEEEWSKIAAVLKVNEEYYGFYTGSYHSDIESTLNDMITEANPKRFADFMNDCEKKIDSPNLICLISLAWEKFENSPDDFSAWEMDKVAKL
jgi:hypothetical protein